MNTPMTKPTPITISRSVMAAPSCAREAPE